MSDNLEINDSGVLARYKESIDYYWKASRKNKRAYKLSRYLTIILGALVTFISAMSSADFIVAIEELDTTFAILTPIIALSLTIIGGFAQNFHWGATWRDMVLNAQRLTDERDRFLSTKESERDLQKELKVLNSMVISESESFFKRVIDSVVRPDKDSNNR